MNPSVFFGMSVEYFLENVVRKDKSPRSSFESEIHVGVEALKCYRLEHGQVAKVYNRGKSKQRVSGHEKNRKRTSNISVQFFRK